MPYVIRWFRDVGLIQTTNKEVTMMFSRKAKRKFDLDHELLVALDKARESGMSAHTIAAAFQNRADQVRQMHALSSPDSGAVMTTYYDPLTMKPIVR
jgi:hypothetical protein